jgi:asparagine synthase (glutamine-hydrolysing)
MVTPDGRFALVFNGEVYNFREVADVLRDRGVRFAGGSDTEVILYAWQEWGPACLDRLRGMFAFALFDSREERLYLARDRLGEKPLYYWHDGRRFVFASEVRALLASGAVPRIMDSDGLDAYLTFGSVADPYTLVQDVRALQPGHFAEASERGIVDHRYWALSDIEESTAVMGKAQAAEQVGTIFRDACRLVMESDVPVGVLLSGGIDSSANVVILSELGFDNLNTFSVVFPDRDAMLSEEQWSSLVASRYATTHHVIRVGVEEARTWVVAGVSHMDQPSFDGINTYLVARSIGGAGIKVAVSGQGGDELFLGYSKRKVFPALARLAGLPGRSAIRPLARRASRMNRLHDTRAEKALELIQGSTNPFESAYLANHTIFSQAGLERLRGEPRPNQARFVGPQGGTTPLGKFSRLDLAYYLRNTLLRDADQMSMANSVELRQPFLDARLVDAVLRLPIQTKVRKREQKPLLVDAVGSGLPHEVVDRPKMGFALPYDRWLREGLSLVDPTDSEMGLDRAAVAAVKARFDAGKHWTRYWCLQVLASWIERNGISGPG